MFPGAFGLRRLVQNVGNLGNGFVCYESVFFLFARCALLISCIGCGTSRTFGTLKRRLGQGQRTFSSMRHAWHFLDVDKALAAVGQNETRFWKSLCMAGAIFDKFGGHFERVESLGV